MAGQVFAIGVALAVAVLLGRTLSNWDTVGTEAPRQVFELRRDRLLSLLEIESHDRDDGDAVPDDQELRLRLLHAERDALRCLYEHGEISGRTRLEISQELDLDETRLRRDR